MLVKELIQKLEQMPAEAEVFYEDPNFGGAYYKAPELRHVSFDNGKCLIAFPFETPLE